MDRRITKEREKGKKILIHDERARGDDDDPARRKKRKAGLGVAADGDGRAADPAERRAGPLPAQVPEDEAHLGQLLLLVRLVHLHLVALLLLDLPHLAVHHPRRRQPLPFLVPRILHRPRNHRRFPLCF